MIMVYLIIIFFGGALLYAVILGASKQPAKKRGGRTSSIDRVDINHKWTAILASSKTGAAGLKGAISDADKLFDYAMKQLGYPGETFADRLKVAQRELSNRDAVWRAHKLRNALAHEMGFDLVPSQANEALRDFERGLNDLGAL